MKWFFLLLIFILCLAFGLMKQNQLKMRLSLLKTFRSFLCFSSDQIRFYATPSDLIIQKACDQKEYEPIHFIQKIQSLDASSIASLSADDFHLMKSFLQSLGSRDIEGELNNCNYYIRLVDEKIDAAKENLKVSGKLTVTLSLFMGIGLIIMLA